ncbi:MAG: hypothetical protein ACLPVY_03735 [Acidimicrobiia bacterium]
MTSINLNAMSVETQGDPYGQYGVYQDEDAGFGSLFFAGTMLGLAGIMRLVDAFWAFYYKGALPQGLANGVLGSHLGNYAWLWLAVGILLIVSSFLILVHSQFGRWVGFAAATVGAVSAMVWMPYYPVWSLMYVLIAVLVFHSLVRYGGREAI